MQVQKTQFVRNITKKNLILVAILLLSLALISCGSVAVKYDDGIETILFTDGAGRTVELPKDITKVAPSGTVATMMLAILCPEYMVCVSGTPSSSQYQYLPHELFNLPTTGQFYGTRSTINMESLIKAAPEIIIDLGDRKKNIASDMDRLQKTTGIATIYLEADLIHAADAYRALGEILDIPERAEEIALFIDETMEMAAKNAARIPESDRKTVMFTSGTTGLNANALGSVQAEVIDVVGAKNAIVVDGISNAAGGNPIGLEQLYNFDPEVILFTGGSMYAEVAKTEAWAGLSAVKNGKYYEIPDRPYNWMANPPSINRILGVWWLGNLLYPDIYDYDMTEAAKRVYKLFWDYDMTTEEAAELLADSTLKTLKTLK